MNRLIFVIAGCLILNGYDLAAKEPPTRLVYEVDVKPDEKVDPAAMKKLVDAVNCRANPGIVFSLFSRVVVRQVGDRRIEVLVPAGKPEWVARIERVASQAGTLEFRILANRHDHKELIERAEKTGDAVLRDKKDQRLAWWVPVMSGEEENFGGHRDMVTRERKQGDRKVLEVLVVRDAYNVTGQYLDHVQSGVDGRGQPCVRFAFNKTGARLFGGLTQENLPDDDLNVFRKLGIILGGKLYSAPIIRGVIHGNGEISGRFTQQEVEDIVDVLNSGSLPLPIRKVELDEPADATAKKVLPES